MSEFSSLLLKINEQFKKLGKVHLSGLDIQQWSFIFLNFLSKNPSFANKNHLFVCSTDEEAEQLSEALKLMNSNVLYYPGLTQSPFSSVIQSEAALTQRHAVLGKIISATVEPFFVVLSLSSLLLKTPPRSFFKSNYLKIKVSDIISPDELALLLVQLGYSATPTIEEVGTFSKKGEIFDIFPINHQPIRINYFDDMIENIFTVDSATLKTNKSMPIEELVLQSTPMSIMTNERIITFRSKLRKPLNNFKQQNTFRNSILQGLADGYFFENYPLYYSLFFEENDSFVDFLPHGTLIHFYHFDQANNDFNFQLEEMNQIFSSMAEEDVDLVLPSPDNIFHQDINYDKFECFFIDAIDFGIYDNQENLSKIPVLLESIAVFTAKNLKNVSPIKFEFIRDLLNSIKKLLSTDGYLNIVYKNESSKNEIAYLLETHGLLPALTNKINFIYSSLNRGFYYQLDNLFFLTEADFFSERIKKTKKIKRTHMDLFADQISTLKVGDFVIHKQFGIGKYLGIENLSLNQSDNDFLVIEYLDGDKVYVPVYKLNLVQKHAEHQVQIKLDNLRTKKFDVIKSKAKSSVKKLAFDLLELQAKRKLKKGFAFSGPDHLFKEFELSFDFEETPDQIRAIDDVLEDMQKDSPMDRLVCGDVGFGKTEVAMRASFKAVLDHKQVALLVPTTVLAYQHFNTFMKRFANFPVNIEFISRFKTAKQITEVQSKLKNGQIDILIGTHKILSESIQFKDLGLLIIDEEQRFGVGHKEKLKLMRENVDCLVLTATPIPRTLQLSFLGVKELSLIQTAPPKRQSIKTYVIKEDPYTLKMAINKELSRGGQIFVVHNRVHDINDYAAKIKKLVPSAKIVVAHGQMKEKELEKYITEFYEHKYDILVSTTIIESGIDIPSANTMIIDRADMYGLSQLHQLRGRIGRSDKKAYAYFIVPSHKNLSEIASKRLKALQTYADMGAGFSLATSDLEIRGSGDILGAEQSGHIANIGLELYMELLQEAIDEIKGNAHQNINRDIEIQTPFSSFIPNKYISDQGHRLKYYKRLANCYQFDSLSECIDELTDQYGQLPEPLKNLEHILRSRIYLRNLGLNSVKVHSKNVTLNFDKNELDSDETLRNKIIHFFTQRPKVYKIKPNYSVICSFKDEIKPESLVEFAKYIAEQIDLC